jgi:hypothetical protein
MNTGRSTSRDSRPDSPPGPASEELQQADAYVERGEQAATGLSPRRAARRRLSIGSDPTGDTLTMSAALLVVADRPQPIPTIDSTIACTAVEWAASQRATRGSAWRSPPTDVRWSAPWSIAWQRTPGHTSDPKRPRDANCDARMTLCAVGVTLGVTPDWLR